MGTFSHYIDGGFLSRATSDNFFFRTISRPERSSGRTGRALSTPLLSMVTVCGAREPVRRLHGAIVDQRLPAGSRLTETAIAELLVASRRHVDKALWRLAQEKLVRMRRNAGAWVAAPSMQEAREIYGLRLVVEEAATRQACNAWRIEGFRTLKANLVAEEQAYKAGDLREAVRLSGEFHVLLAGLSGSGEIRCLVEQLVARTSLVTQLYTNPEGLGCWHSHHYDLMDAISQRQADRAAELMRGHLIELEEALRVSSPSSRHRELEAALQISV